MPLGQVFPGGATKADYLGSSDEIAPVADPNVTSETMKLQLATALKTSAASTPGYDHDAVEMRFLKALHVDAPEQVFPGTKGQPPAKDPKLVIEETKIQGRLQEQQLELQARQQEFTITLMEERRVNNAKILELMAKADNESANAQTEQAYAQVAMINAQISMVKDRNEHINAKIEHLLKAAEIRSNHMIEMKKAEQPPAKKAA